LRSEVGTLRPSEGGVLLSASRTGENAKCECLRAEERGVSGSLQSKDARRRANSSPQPLSILRIPPSSSAALDCAAFVSLSRVLFTMRPCGRAATPITSIIHIFSSVHVPLAHPGLGSATSKKELHQMHSRMQLAFRRTKDVVSSREQGMQAGPMPVASRVCCM
jgi:hypothetical protein